jgi:uncharacterized caspase-like protein
MMQPTLRQKSVLTFCKLTCLLVLMLGISGVFSETAWAKSRSTLISAKSQQRVALVIGNGRYAQGILKNPENDAQTVAKKLESLGFSVDFHTNLNQQDMLKHVFDFFHHKAAKSLLRVVYFAGHGVQYEGKNYLIPVDANLAFPADIPQNSFQLDELRRNLDALSQGASIIILDNCRVNLCPAPPCRGIMSSLDLSEKRRSSGTLIAYPPAPGRPASDGGKEVNSLYTQTLVELMDTPGLSVENLFRKLTEAVFQHSRGQQKPEFVNGLMGDEVCFKSGTLGECPLQSH